MCGFFYRERQLKLPTSKEGNGDLQNIQNIWKLDKTYLKLVS